MEHEAVGATIGVAEEKIEITAAETNEEQRDADDATRPMEQMHAFQSNTATTRVAVMPPRNKLQNVRLCQLPGSGAGQTRKGGASAKEEQVERRACNEAGYESEVGHWHDLKADSLCKFATAR